MARKIILDCDPGIDDALAIAIALFDPTVEVLALTSVAGNASAATTGRNLQGIVEMLDPPRLPRIGVGEEPENAMFETTVPLFGSNGLGGYVFPVATRCNPALAEKVICDQVRAYPNEVSILTFGPLTNIARAFQRDPELPSLVDSLYIGGGTYEAPGNVTPAAEFNIHCDPKAAQFVLQSPCAKTLVPLDVTNKIRLTYQDFGELSTSSTRFGDFLHQTLNATFHLWRQQFGLEEIFMQAPATYLAMKFPDMYLSLDAAVDVETEGHLCRGATVFDRRIIPIWRYNVEVIQASKSHAIMKKLIKMLNLVINQLEND